MLEGFYNEKCDVNESYTGLRVTRDGGYKLR